MCKGLDFENHDKELAVNIYCIEKVGDELHHLHNTGALNSWGLTPDSLLV